MSDWPSRDRGKSRQNQVVVAGGWIGGIAERSAAIAVHPTASPAVGVSSGLMSDQATGQATGQAAFQLWPESGVDFFLKEVDAQVTFTVDAQGVVTGLVLHQGGQNGPGKKVR